MTTSYAYVYQTMVCGFSHAATVETLQCILVACHLCHLTAPRRLSDVHIEPQHLGGHRRLKTRSAAWRVWPRRPQGVETLLSACVCLIGGMVESTCPFENLMPHTSPSPRTAQLRCLNTSQTRFAIARGSEDFFLHPFLSQVCGDYEQENKSSVAENPSTYHFIKEKKKSNLAPFKKCVSLKLKGTLGAPSFHGS